MPSEVPVDRWKGVDGLQFFSQEYPTHAALDSSPGASTHHEVQQGEQCVGKLATTRLSVYLKYTPDIVLQHQCEDPTEKPDIIFAALAYSNVFPDL
ncbi:hypothetical protein TNCV_4949131 [Trichonephila clavipes]|nr:hypothetical protein TNCV_4949131 [Trichonephila clavipes]